MHDSPPNLEFWKTLAFALLAAFGGGLGYIMRALEHGKSVKWGRAFLELAAAGFVGLLATLLCKALNLDDLWTGVIVGVFGWMGANATIRVIEAVIYNKLGITKEQIPEEK